MRRNKLAKLTKHTELAYGWFGISFFHLRRVTELKSHANHFFLCFNQDSYGMAVKEICFFRSTPGLIRMPTTKRLANCSERRPARNCRTSPSNVKSVCKAPGSLLRKTMIRHLPIRRPLQRM